MPQDGVPRGTVTKHSWTSKIFPGTVRDYWVYVPQFPPAKTAHTGRRARHIRNVFAGPDLNTLVVTCGDKVYERKTKAKGVLAWKTPIKPPAPKVVDE